MHAPIAIYCSSRAAGGLELNVVRMATWLQAAGYPVCTIAAPDSEISRRLNKERIPHISASKRNGKPSVLQLRRILRDGNYHTLFVHTS
jgi:hypothetical protein